MSRLVYQARIAPIDRFTRVLDRERGAIYERFDRFAFPAQVRDPSRVTVDLRHEERFDVGHLTKLTPRGDWWVCEFELNTRAIAAYAEDMIEVGTPVSIGFTPLHQRHIGDDSVYYTLCKLESVAIVDRAAYDGTQVTAVHKVPTPPRRAASTVEPRVLRRPSGVILGIK